MPKTMTRRQAGAAVAAGALAIGAGLPVTAFADEHPDARLLELWDERMRLWQEYDDASREEGEVMDALPDDLRSTVAKVYIGGGVAVSDRDAMIRARAETLRALPADAMTEAREAVAHFFEDKARELERLGAERKAVHDRYGLTAIRDRMTALSHRMDENDDAIAATPAKTIAGLVVKLRLACATDCDNGFLPGYDTTPTGNRYAEALANAEALAGMGVRHDL